MKQEILRAVGEVIPKELMENLKEPLEKAIETGLKGPAQEAFHQAYDASGGQKSTGLTFDEFDKYLLFALKVIGALWAVAATAWGILRYKVVWDVVKGNVTRSNDKDRYELAVQGLEIISTSGQEAMRLLTQGAEHLKSIAPDLAKRLTELLDYVQEKKERERLHIA